jgi:hypothetical protein
VVRSGHVGRCAVTVFFQKRVSRWSDRGWWCGQARVPRGVCVELIVGGCPPCKTPPRLCGPRLYAQGPMSDGHALPSWRHPGHVYVSLRSQGAAFSRLC